MGFAIIAAIGKNRELGKKGGLIWHLPGDLAFFKKATMGHPVFMGERTFLSLPKMLPGRKHYVLSMKAAADFEKNDNLVIINELDDFVDIHKDDDPEMFVIGGGMVYAEMIDHADTLYLTEIDASCDDADTFFPEFDKSKYQREELGKGEDNGINYTFVRYTKIK